MRIRDLLQSGADAEQLDEYGDTPLVKAARTASAACVRELLWAGADANRIDKHGWSALTYACMRNDLDMVHELIVGRADVNCAASRGITPLMTACLYDHVGCARALLEADADVHKCSASGWSALCRSTSLAMAQLLCASGADREVLFSSSTLLQSCRAEVVEWLDRTRQWITPLHHLELLSKCQVRKFLASGADVNAKCSQKGSPSPLSLAIELLDQGPHEAAEIVMVAAQPWSPATHALFPARARKRVIELLCVGYALSQHINAGCMLRDVWLSIVIPLAVQRENFLT